MIKFDVLNRFSGAVQFTAEIECGEDDAKSYKIGLSVKWALKNKANLSGANLYGADLSRADLSRADLSGANLYGANLYGANLSGAENAEVVVARTRILPEGDLIGWKKCREGVVVKLRIPSEAKRSHAFGRKCRAEYADVLEVIGADKGVSLHDGETEYVSGARVTPSSFDENWQKECAAGIHFYITKAEAEAHT